MSSVSGEPRLLFIGINSLFSERHFAAVAASVPVGRVVETLRPMGALKRLERSLVAPRLSRAAKAAGAEFHEVGHDNRVALLAILRAYRPDLVIVAGMGRLLRPDELAVPCLGALNVHPALLPAYRGAEPTVWQLRDGVGESGVTVHLVDPGEDTGPILGQARFPVPPGATLADMLAMQLQHGPPLLAAAVRDHLAGTARPAAQPRTSPTRRACRLSADQVASIRWLDHDLESAWRLLRGIGPILGCPPARWRDLGHVGFVTGLSPERSPLAPGAIGRDGHGWFLAHPQGRLYLRWRWLPRAWLLALRRGRSPAVGVIALETAAGLAAL